MNRLTFRARALALLAGFGLASGAAAQAPRGADTLSDAAVAESLAVLKTLEATIAANPRDAAAYYRQGMVAWALLERSKAKPPLKTLDGGKLNRMADSSIRRAALLDKTNPLYPLAIGRMLLSSNLAIVRASSYGYFDEAVEVARKGTDKAALAEAAIEAGRVRWRRYDNDAHKRMPTDTGLFKSIAEAATAMNFGAGGNTSILSTVDDAFPAMGLLHSRLIDLSQEIKGAGESEYQAAEAYFREAYTADPSNSRAFRQLAMLLAEKNRWTELRSASRDRVQRIPSDPAGWFALGLASMRSKDAPAAAAAFDSALSRSTPAERARLTGLQRVLPPKDTSGFKRAPAEARSNSERRFWLMADPLWSRQGAEPRTEFLARVTYAELRWTVEEMNVRGADSDRGDVLIRFGPPDTIATFPPSMDRISVTDQQGAGFRRGGTLTPGQAASQSTLAGLVDQNARENVGKTVTVWDYNSGLSVVFIGQPTYGTASLPSGDRPFIDYAVDKKPVTWDNVESGRITEMPVRMARFRTPNDSIDLFLAALAPIASIRASSSMNSPVTGSLWLLGENNPKTISDESEFARDGAKVWVYRLAQDNYLYRIEATADGASDAGRASAWLKVGDDVPNGFLTKGFGISDLLIASRTLATARPERWTDFSIIPLLTAAAQGSELSFVWENYEFGNREGQAQYEIALSIARERSSGGRVAAEVISALARAIGVDRVGDRVTYRFDRTVAHATAIVDNIAISLRETPAGTYRVTLDITDKVTGRRGSRSLLVNIAK